MKYTGMPFGMWALFAGSFQKQLTAVLGYDAATARAITKKAKPQYRQIIRRLPEFEKADRFKMNLINCAMLGAFILSMPQRPEVDRLTDYYAKSMMTKPMQWFCRKSGKSKFTPKDIAAMKATAALKAADLNPYSWNMEFYEYMNAVLSYVTNAQIGDSTSEYFLRSLGVANFDVCIVTIGGNFQSSLETTSLLKELGAKLVVSRAERDVQAKFLLRNGADEVVYPEKQLAKWAAIRYSSEHILDYIELQDDHAIMEVTIPPEWMDRTIGEINIRKKYNINILALKKDGKLNMNITPDTQLCRDESMLVLGKYASIQKCFRL